jgi:CrcB protein
VNAAAFAAVGVGAVLGAWARWGLSTWLNPVTPDLPLGTLLVNAAGGYLIGAAVAYFDAHATLAPEWRLFCITGFLGAMTTFSAFSAEAMQLLQAGKYLAAALHSGAHLLGAILATVLGFASVRALA